MLGYMRRLSGCIVTTSAMLQCRVIFGSSGHKKRPKKGVLQVTAVAIACWLLWCTCSYAVMRNDQRRHLLFINTGPCAMQSYTKCLNRTNGHAVHIKSIVNTDFVGTRHLCVGHNCEGSLHV
jgi:hypothetical protein